LILADACRNNQQLHLCVRWSFNFFLIISNYFSCNFI
jgi:hypothetical protein